MSLLPYAWAKSQRILLRPGEAGLLLTVCPSTPGWSISEVQRQFGQSRLEQVRDDELDGLLASAYADTGSAAAVVGAAENEVDLDRLMQDMPEITDLLDTQDGAPVIRMINALLTQAARDEASDIHIEPYETHSVVRYRVDGTLRDVVSPRKALHGALVSRIKIMAQLDIAEKRLPQDGRIALRVAGRPIDIRVSTVPTGHGERVVMRLLDKQAGRLQLETLGMEPQLLARLDTLIRQPHGIVLVTGPTGSGKTTSLYAALARLDASTSNILTVEDPVEYDLPGISQIQVNAKIDMTFGLALRAILRQDPDIIMIGEIRDLETAADRRASLAHRPPGARHPAHQRRGVGGQPPDRYGRRTVPAGVFTVGRVGPAPGAAPVPALQAGRPGRAGHLAPGGLRAVQPDRLQRAYRYP